MSNGRIKLIMVTTVCPLLMKLTCEFCWRVVKISSLLIDWFNEFGRNTTYHCDCSPTTVFDVTSLETTAPLISSISLISSVTLISSTSFLYFNLNIFLSSLYLKNLSYILTSFHHHYSKTYRMIFSNTSS